MRRWIPGSLVVLSLVLAPAFARAACECPPPLAVPDALAASTYVFAGTVTSTIPYQWGPSPAFANMTLATVAVTLTWKGHTSTEMMVFTSASADYCGYPLAVGQAYLFYADVIDLGVAGPWYYPLVSSCSRTAPLADNPDLGLLPPGETPVPARQGSWGALKSRYR